MKKLMRVSLAMLMVFLLIPTGTAQAASETVGDFVVTTEVVSGYTYSANILKFTSPGSYTLSMKDGVSTTTNDRIQIEGGTSANPIDITLSGVSINTWSSAIHIANSSYVRLNLAAGTTNMMTGGAYYAGILCPSAATLVIGGTGTLNATGGGGAGIGGSGGVVYEGNSASGTIIINGGTVNAQGGSYCAGIGGGGSIAINCGAVTISGGNVTATGGTGCPGIGAGHDAATNTPGTAESITISSGTVTATGGSDGAGIGGSKNGSAKVAIGGGSITATGGSGGAGIGCGNSGGGGEVTISGGNVTATGSDGGAGIGGGSIGSGGTVTITGGAVTATGSNNSAIGGGSAGIGGGSYRNGGTITITNGTVTADGISGGAGIGGGYSGRCGEVNISGGTVTATGSDYQTYGGAGIGDGGYGGGGYIISSADVVITGGSVKAAGGTDAVDIGHGAYGTGGALTSGETNGDKPVYLTTVTLQGAADGTAVTSLIADPGYSYGCSGMKTGASGVVYLYLPSGAETTAATTGGGTYTGSVTTTNNHLAAGTLTIQSYIQLAVPKNLVWDTTVPGEATWNAVTGALNYSVQLYKGGVAQGIAVSASAAEYDFTAAIHTAGNGTYTFTVTAVGDGTNYHSSAASAAGPGYFYSDPLITTSATLPSAAINAPYSCTFSASGTTPITWSFVSGYIPYGLTLSSSGVLSGTPISAYSTSFILQAENANGFMQKEFSITIVDPSTLPSLAASSVLEWDSTVPGKAVWSAVDHASAYSVQLYKGGAVQGSAVTSSALEYNFTSAIEAAGSGNYTFSVTALGDNLSYQNGLSSGQSIDVYEYTAPTAPTITITTLPGGTVNSAYSQTLTATGTAAIEWSVTVGTLPGGVTLSTAGVLSGTPATAGTFNFTVQAENSAGSDTQGLSLVIAPDGYISRTLTDSATGIVISGGGIHQDAVLTVNALNLHESGACGACDAIRARMASDAWTLILGRDISLSYGFTGTLTITIPVGAEYNGQTITILHCAGGTLQTVTAAVTGGKAVFTVNSLSPFAVLAQSELTLASSDSDGTIYTGGRITLTPSVSGGTWSFNSASLSRDGNTFTALKAGISTVTYTVDGASVTCDVTVANNGLPDTGQNYLWAAVLGALAVCTGITAALAFVRKRAKRA